MAALARTKPAVRTTYVDGGQHPSFRAQARRGNRALGQVSRPETLAFAGKEIELLPDGSPKPEAPPKPEKAARSAAKGKRTSGPRPMVMPAEASPGPAERSLYEQFLGGFRTEGTAAPAPERRL